MQQSLLLAWLVLAAPTYPQVAPILNRKCCGCHRPGLAAPMPLGTYAEVTTWSESIREAVESRRMPPWGADPRHGRWSNDRSLSADERSALLAWIEAGCPEGEPIRIAAAAATGWRIKPDVIFTMPEEVSVPANGQIPYQFAKVPTGFTEDVWVQAAEIRPGSKAVHHILILAHPVDQVYSVEFDMLASYLPGDDPLELPPGYAKRLPAGAPLIFQIHYSPTGKPEKDRSSIGLVLAKEPPRREVRTANVELASFLIPAGAANHELKCTRTFNLDAELLSFTPHMHLRGKDFKYDIAHPDGKTETLLSVPKYDFNWQTTYRLDRPIAIAAGSRLDCTAHYDNSAANPHNPDPTQPVFPGPQTTEEMLIGFADYSVPRGAGPAFWRPGPPAELHGALPDQTWLLPVASITAGCGILTVAAARLISRRRSPSAR